MQIDEFRSKSIEKCRIPSIVSISIENNRFILRAVFLKQKTGSGTQSDEFLSKSIEKCRVSSIVSIYIENNRFLVRAFLSDKKQDWMCKSMIPIEIDRQRQIVSIDFDFHR